MANRRVTRSALVAGLAATTLALAGCGGSGPAANDGKPQVVASTSVWASVAEAVGGDSVDVEALITDPAADPHSYETTPRDAAKISDADLVVYNGGGYDEFVDQVLGNGQRSPAVRALEGEGGHEHGGHGHEGGEHGAEGGEHGHDHSANEHVWYDLHVVHETADRIADELGKLRPEQAKSFKDAAARFSSEVGGLEKQVEQIAARHSGKQVIVTEPVAHYLVEQAGLRDVTPQSFVNAVEAENDPSAAAVAEMQDAVRSRQAAAVLYNPQTESPVTENVRKTAEQSGIPVVEMTETLPADRTYVQWMKDQITALDTALAR